MDKNGAGKEKNDDDELDLPKNRKKNEKGKKKKPTQPDTSTSIVRFDLPIDDSESQNETKYSNQKQKNYSKPSSSKQDESASNEDLSKETENFSAVDNWIDQMLTSPRDFKGSTKNTAATLPKIGKASTSLIQHNRISSYGASNDTAVIRRKLSFLLPSYTLTRSHRSASEQEAQESAMEKISLQRKMTENRYSSVRAYKSFIASKKSSPLLPIDSVQSAEIAVEELTMDETDEEKLHQLSSIRSLPMPIKEKRKMRDSILSRITQPSRLESKFMARRAKVRANCKRIWKEFIGRTEIWSATLKKVEGRFGAGVVSYLVFLRFLLLLNFIMFLFFLLFVVLPQALSYTEKDKEVHLAPNISAYDENFDSYFKKSINPSESSRPVANIKFDNLWEGNIGLEELASLFDSNMFQNLENITLNFHQGNYTSAEQLNISRYCSAAYNSLVKNQSSYNYVIQDLLQGTGILEHTLLFIGHYKSEDTLLFGHHYDMSLAFLFVLFSILICSVFMMINFTSQGAKEALLSRTGSIATYSNILFSSWDYCMVDEKTARMKHNSIVVELKSTLSEARRESEIKKWSAVYKAEIFFKRCAVNIAVIAILIGCYYFIYLSAEFQMKKYHQRELNRGGFYVLLIQFLCPFTILSLNLIMIIVFPLLTSLEKYHAETETNITLIRYLFLRLSSLIVMVSSFYYEITCQPQNMCGLGMSAECPSPMCWETFVGQQIYKLVIMDIFVYISIAIFLDFPWDYTLKHYQNRITELVGRQVFDIPTQVLALLYSQSLAWLGMFYSPLLPFINVLKIVLIFYLKRFTLSTCQPDKMPYKASRSNAIFMLFLFVVFFFVLFVLGFSISNLPPSPGCSPFRVFSRMMDAIPSSLHHWARSFTDFLQFVFSTVFYIPLGILLCLGIYYYVTIISAHKRMAKLLSSRLILEGRDKEFLLSRITEAAKQSF